jgi:hypothetical protein
MATSTMILADTNILIELFKGNQSVLADLQQIGPNNIAISAVTVMELYCGALNKLELQRIRKHLRAFHLCPIKPEMSDQATVLIERYAKSHGLLIPDALIAATALFNNYPLLTLNLKDFRYIDGLMLHS